jgi:hypothetical protein
MPGNKQDQFEGCHRRRTLFVRWLTRIRDRASRMDGGVSLAVVKELNNALTCVAAGARV